MVKCMECAHYKPIPEKEGFGESMERKKVPYSVGGIKLGTFDADVCSCGEVFFTEKSSDAIDEASRDFKKDL